MSQQCTTLSSPSRLTEVANLKRRELMMMQVRVIDSSYVFSTPLPSQPTRRINRTFEISISNFFLILFYLTCGYLIDILYYFNYFFCEFTPAAGLAPGVRKFSKKVLTSFPEPDVFPSAAIEEEEAEWETTLERFF